VTPPQSTAKPEPARNDAAAGPRPPTAGAESGSDGPPENSGAEVVRLDRFRKK
jgi:hypothetical protein